MQLAVYSSPRAQSSCPEASYEQWSKLRLSWDFCFISIYSVHLCLPLCTFRSIVHVVLHGLRMMDYRTIYLAQKSIFCWMAEANQSHLRCISKFLDLHDERRTIAPVLRANREPQLTLYLFALLYHFFFLVACPRKEHQHCCRWAISSKPEMRGNSGLDILFFHPQPLIDPVGRIGSQQFASVSNN